MKFSLPILRFSHVATIVCQLLLAYKPVFTASLAYVKDVAQLEFQALCLQKGDLQELVCRILDVRWMQ